MVVPTLAAPAGYSIGFRGDNRSVTAEPLLDVEPETLAGDDEVLRALVHRRDRGRRDDGHRIALVVGGGGMRGAYSGGMAHALDDNRLSPWFDVVYGSSAGAFVGAAVILGDSASAAAVYHEDMACRAFIDPRRIGAGRPMVSLDYLIDQIMVTSKPMPWARLRDSRVPLKIIATAADDLTGHVLAPRTIDEWRRAFRATATIPFVAGPPVALHGRMWIDGSVAEPLPVPRALREGATHVLALLNRSVPELRLAEPEAPPARWAAAIDRVVPGLGAMAQESRRHGEVVALLADAGHIQRAGAHVLAVAPRHGLGIRGLTTDAPRVREATEAGYTALQEALDRALAPG